MVLGQMDIQKGGQGRHSLLILLILLVEGPGQQLMFAASPLHKYVTGCRGG